MAPLSKIIFFPDPETADETGLLAMGGRLDTEVLCEAYGRGIFPWPHEGYPLLWFSPPQRGIIKFHSLHVPSRLNRLWKQGKYTFTLDKDFATVIERCSSVPRKGEKGTWINDELKAAYIQFHRDGFAHSVECWEGSLLVGGIYGVCVSGVFSAESMFGLRNNVSKLCLIELICHLRECGLKWVDIQVLTSVTTSLGGEYISRDSFLALLRETHKKKLKGFGGR